MTLPFPFSLAIEAAINAGLRLDANARKQLSSIDGKTIRIVVKKPELSVLVAVVDGRIQLIDHSEDPADTTIVGTLAGLRSLSDSNDALYQSEVRIDGDLKVAETLKHIVRSIDPDWQDVVSPVLGDLVTHRIDVAQQQFSSWIKRTQTNARLNTRDYLEEEIQWLVPACEVVLFCDEVDETRAAADRLNARLSLLEKQRQLSSEEPEEC